MMQTSAAGVALIKQFEGCELTAYQDDVGVWTIGYGTTSGVYGGQIISQVKAEELLRKDLVMFEKLPIDYVLKKDLNDDLHEIRTWLRSINDKIDTLILSRS